jgi:hypothetical protein
VTKSEGRCKIDAVEVGELDFKGLGPQPPVLSVRYAYANSRTGDRFGSSNRNQGWSEKTLGLLSQLVESIEQDVARDLFNDSATISSGDVGGFSPTDSIPSL